MNLPNEFEFIVGYNNNIIHKIKKINDDVYEYVHSDGKAGHTWSAREIKLNIKNKLWVIKDSWEPYIKRMINS